jgi:exonuclease SbcC
MKLKSLKLSDLTRFHDQEIVIPFGEMPSGLIAICGANGAGKTTVLEASCPGIIYRTMPSRVPRGLAHCARSREAGIELDFEHGGDDYRAKVLVDNVSGKQEAHIWQNGEALVDGKVRDYDREIQAILGAEEEVLASVFAVQGGAGSFVNLSVSERRKLFRKLLGIERMDSMAKHANDEAKRYAQEYEFSLKGHRVREDVESDLNDLYKQVAESTDLLAKVVTSCDEANRGYEFAQSQYRELEKRLRESHSTAMAQHEILKASKEKAVLVAARHKDLKTGLEREIASKAHFEKSIKSITGRLSKGLTGYDRVKGFDANEAKLSVLELSEQLVEMREAKAEHEKSVSECYRLDLLEAQLAAQCGVDTPCEPDMKSECPLASAANDAQEKLKSVTEALSVARARVSEKPVTDEGIIAMEERLAVLRDDLRDYASYTTRASELESSRAEDKAELSRLEGELAKVSQIIPSVQASLEALGAVPSVEAENERYKAVRAQYDVIYAKRMEVVRFGEQKADERKRLNSERERISNVLNELKLALAGFEKEEKMLDEAETRAKESHIESTAWKALAVGLGSFGVQALEIDAAGPRVSTIANELLRASHGARFEVHVVTSKAKTSGKGFTENFSVEVIDHVRGNASDLANLSGGEKVIVDEAIRLAISLFRNEELKTPWKTLWRDETTGALDAENAGKYIAMLRKAQEIGGFDQVVFIAHQQDVIEAADARVELVNSRVSIS